MAIQRGEQPSSLAKNNLALIVSFIVLTILVGQIGFSTFGQEVRAEKINVALVLDRSVSMATLDRLVVAQEGATIFVKLARAGDRIALVAFHDTGEIVESLAEITLDGLSDLAKQTLQGEIDAIAADRTTNLGAGLQAALDALQAASPPQRSCVVLLSNGQNNTGFFSSQLNELRALRWPVYTIAVGLLPTTKDLQVIAQETGGLFLQALTEDALLSAIVRAQAGCRGQVVASFGSGTITQGVTIIREVPIFDSSATLAQFILAWGGSDLALTLIRPDGTQIDPAVAGTDPNVEYAATSMQKLYTVKNPTAGLWRMVITGADVPNPETFADAAILQSSLPVFVNFIGLRNGYSLGETIPIRVDLRDVVLPDGRQPILGATVKATVTLPDASQVTLELFDDGKHDDGAAGDGVYGNSLTGTVLEGSYTIQVTAEGSATNGPFTRTIAHAVQVTLKPILESASPAGGDPGDQLTVTLLGKNFMGAIAVSFGAGIAVNAFTVNGDTQITANITIAEDAAPGPRDVTVLNASGTGTGAGLFQVNEPPPPAITAVSPNNGDRGETLTVTVTGANFTGATTVSFGSGITVNDFTIDSDTQITANITIAGDATPGPRDVSVTNAVGTGVGQGLFTVNPPQPPVISSVSPSSAQPGDKLTVTLTGENFTGTTSVSFGPGITVSLFNVVSDTQLQAAIDIQADAAPGPRDVRVTNEAGTGALPGGFTVQTPPVPPGFVVFREISRCVAAAGLAMKILILQNGSGSSVTIADVRPTGSGWESFTLIRGIGTVASGRTTTIVARGTCTGDDLAVEVVLGSGAVLTAGLSDPSSRANLEVWMRRGLIHLRAHGPAIAEVRAQAYSLSGAKLWEGRALGRHLITLPMTPDGRPWANGVYVLVITVRNADGTVSREIRRLAILR